MKTNTYRCSCCNEVTSNRSKRWREYGKCRTPVAICVKCDNAIEASPYARVETYRKHTDEKETVTVRIEYTINVATFKVGLNPNEPFQYGTCQRTRLLRAFLRSEKPRAAMLFHEVSNFVVERLRKRGDGETWEIGS